jgi:hypothetical protein
LPQSSVDALTDVLELVATDYRLERLDQVELIEFLEESQKRVRLWRQH